MTRKRAGVAIGAGERRRIVVMELFRCYAADYAFVASIQGIRMAHADALEGLHTRPPHQRSWPAVTRMPDDATASYRADVERLAQLWGLSRLPDAIGLQAAHWWCIDRHSDRSDRLRQPRRMWRTFSPEIYDLDTETAGGRPRNNIPVWDPALETWGDVKARLGRRFHAELNNKADELEALGFELRNSRELFPDQIEPKPVSADLSLAPGVAEPINLHVERAYPMLTREAFGRSVSDVRNRAGAEHWFQQRDSWDLVCRWIGIE